MGACVASRLGEEEEVVSICRERKHQLKLAVERRYTLADAHYRYCQSLNGVSAAINLFVTCHSTASSPFMITFPPPASPQSPPKENVVSNPLFLQQTPSEPTKQTIPSTKADSSSSSEEEEAEEEMQKVNQPDCGYFYMEPPTSQQNFGWDFFDPFTDVKPDIINRHNRLTEEDLRILREQEGIPELEEDEEKWD